MDKVQAQMFNIANCEQAEFENNMISQYGNKQFLEGWKILQENRSILFED